MKEKRGIASLIIAIILIVVIILIPLTCVGVVSCFDKSCASMIERNRARNKYYYEMDPIESGDFLYVTENYDKNGKRLTKFAEDPYETIAIIMGLSEEGKQKEVIVVPGEIDGIKITKIGKRVYGGMWGPSVDGLWSSSNLKRVYITSPIVIYDVIGGVKVIVTHTDMSSDYLKRIDNADGHLANDLYVASCFRNLDRTGSSANYPYYYTNCANLSYMYNYDDAPNNGYYWIDDYYDGGKIEYIPPIPTRNGYTFGGWYKEVECINEWNFDEDELPKKLRVDNTENDTWYWLYQETILYAKWIEGED